jgi:hypothetical protein
LTHWLSLNNLRAPILLGIPLWKPDANIFPQLLTDPRSQVFYGGMKWFS